MKQAFIYHALAGSDSSLIAPGFADVVTVYFVYTASVTIAAAVVIVSLGFAANVAVGFLDRIVKPAFFAAETQAVPPPSNKSAGVWRTSTRVAG